MSAHPSTERRLETNPVGPEVPTRTERDSLGEGLVPVDAYWGVHTLRALENFPITKRPISVYPELVVALASVKQAAARANRELGVITPQKAAWIDEACQRIIDGELHDQFIVGVIQGLVMAYVDPAIGGSVGSVFPFIIMLAILFIRPTGMFGWKMVERV